MTTTIAALRQGLARNLSTLGGLAVSEYVPDNIVPPMAVISAPAIRYDTSFGRGSDEYSFTIDVFVGRQVVKNAQKMLDALCDPGGVKDALESDRTLSGLVAGLRVTNLTDYRLIEVGEVPLLAASFDVLVITNPE